MHLSSKLQKGVWTPESDFESHSLTTEQFCLPVILFFSLFFKMCVIVCLYVDKYSLKI